MKYHPFSLRRLPWSLGVQKLLDYMDVGVRVMHGAITGEQGTAIVKQPNSVMRKLP